MAVLQFTKERVQSAQQTERGHHCQIIPFPHSPAAQVEKTPTKPSKTGRAKTKRDTLIAKVKIAQKQLGLSDADYRFLLRTSFNVGSCTELDERGLVRLIAHFRSKGWQERPTAGKRKDRHGKPKGLKSRTNPAAPTLQRIEALLSELGKAKGEYVPWDYAAGILKKLTGLDNLDAASVLELRNVMVALENTLSSVQRRQA